MKRCIVHIGTHKTGTTAIQSFCSTHGAALEAAGYYYPRSGRALSGGHHNLGWEIHRSPAFNRTLGTVADLIAEIDRRADDIVLSSEVFSEALLESDAFLSFARRLQATGRDVTALLYVRPQAELVARLYLQLIHFGLDKFLPDVTEEVLRDGHLRWRRASIAVDYRGMFDRLTSVPGVTVILRPYTQQICADFLAGLGVEPRTVLTAGEPRINVTAPVGRYLLRFLRNRGYAPWPVVGRRAIARVAGRHTGTMQLSPAAATALADRFREGNRRVGIPDVPASVAAAPYLDELFSDGTVSALRWSLTRRRER